MYKAIFTLWVVVLIIFVFCFSVFGEEAKKEKRFEVNGFSGLYVVPGFLLGLGSSKHPDHLTGVIYGGAARYLFNDRYSLGLNLFKANVSGFDGWNRDGEQATLASMGIQGDAYGDTTWDLKGVYIDLERRFLSKTNRVRPYARVGLGVGDLNVDFNGTFYGTYAGTNHKIQEPANDHVHRVIPIVHLGSGADVRIVDWLHFQAGGYWNTGYGLEGRLFVRF
jgi:hypothetical protein